MEVRRTFLPHDLQYCLDGGAEYGMITAAADISLRLYAGADRLDAIWNKPEDPERRRPWSWTADMRARNLEVERYAAEIIAQLPAPRQRALVERGLMSLTHQVTEKAEWLAYSFFEDMTKGGCLQPYLDRQLLTRDDRPTPKVARRLRSVPQIKRYVAAEAVDELAHQRALLEILLTIPFEGRAADADREALFADLDGQMDQHRVEARRAIEAARLQVGALQAELPPEVWRHAEALGVIRSDARRKMRERARAVRRATTRAALTAAALLGVATVSAFARGDSVMFSGPEVSFSVQRGRDIGASGHGALQIAVHDAAGGPRLARLCMYQDAPALDQLVSLALHVQAGCGMLVLEAGNLFAVEPAGDQHPIIAARAPKLDRIALDAIRPSRGWHAVFRARQEEYWQEMRPAFEAVVAHYIFGRAAKPFLRGRMEGAL